MNIIGRGKHKVMDQTEFEITKQIIEYLRIIGMFVWRDRQLAKKSTISVLPEQKGIPDILGCYKGRLLGIEVKRPGGVVSDEQQAFLDRINQEGGYAFVAY
jgi:hypothetical protein